MYNTVHRERQVEEGIHNELTFVQFFSIIPYSLSYTNWVPAHSYIYSDSKFSYDPNMTVYAIKYYVIIFMSGNKASWNALMFYLKVSVYALHTDAIRKQDSH
jgi:hypothetical protein